MYVYGHTGNERAPDVGEEEEPDGGLILQLPVLAHTCVWRKGSSAASAAMTNQTDHRTYNALARTATTDRPFNRHAIDPSVYIPARHTYLISASGVHSLSTGKPSTLCVPVGSSEIVGVSGG